MERTGMSYFLLISFSKSSVAVNESRRSVTPRVGFAFARTFSRSCLTEAKTRSSS
jgi:hypothetical protein